MEVSKEGVVEWKVLRLLALTGCPVEVVFASRALADFIGVAGSIQSSTLATTSPTGAPDFSSTRLELRANPELRRQIGLAGRRAMVEIYAGHAEKLAAFYFGGNLRRQRLSDLPSR